MESLLAVLEDRICWRSWPRGMWTRRRTTRFLYLDNVQILCRCPASCLSRCLDVVGRFAQEDGLRWYHRSMNLTLLVVLPVAAMTGELFS